MIYFGYVFYKIKTYIIKISTLIIIFIFIYFSLVHKVSSKMFEKKYAINYIKNIVQNNLNNSFSFPVNLNPNLSIIIPLYNCQNTIKNTIFSVETQNFNNFEIILINDNSQDNTSKIINEIKIKDNRIKVINNKKNMGILYSRSIGALNAMGEYILCLDDDDIFYDDNLFGRIFNISVSKNYDIVEFKSFDIKKFDKQIKLGEIKENPFNCPFENYSLTQPELGLFPISRKNKYDSNDFHIWGKSIKAKIYKKAINMLKIKNFSFYNCWTEDISVIFIIFNIAQTFISIGLYGIIHLEYNKSTTYTLHGSKKLMAEIFLLDIIIKYIQNINTNKKFIFQKLISIFNSKYIQFLNVEHIKYLQVLMNELLNIKNLTKYE